MLVELVAQNLLYFSFACIHVQHSCFPQWFGFSPYSRENYFSQAIFPAIFNLLQVGRMREPFFSMRLQGFSSMTACGTWSPRRSRAIPLCPKKCFCKHMDKRTTAGRMRTARMEIMATSRKKRTLLKIAADSAATWRMWILCLSSFL